MTGKKILILFVLIVSSQFYLNLCHCKEKKLFVVYTDWFPYTYLENGLSKGFEVDIFNEIMKDLNIEFEIKEYPWNRCLYYLKNGKADAVISMLKTHGREAFTYFPGENISLSKTVFFTIKDKHIKFDGDYKLLKGNIVGIISGFSYGKKFDESGFLIKDTSFNPEMLIRKVVAKRNDLGAGNMSVISAYSKKMGLSDKIKFLNQPIHFKKLYVGFSRKNELKDLSISFSEKLKDLKNTVVYDLILEKYGINRSYIQ